MGNTQGGRKRELVDDETIDEPPPPRKKPRLLQFQRQPHLRLSWPSVRPDSHRNDDYNLAERCKSLERQRVIRENPLRQAVSGPIGKTIFPVPWVEALFLPEFPTRSLVTEQNFIFNEELGTGTFGRVYRVVVKHSSDVYALKIQEKSRIISRNAVEQRQLRPHVFIARLYATWQSRARIFSLMQYPEGGFGDLFTLWRDHGNFGEDTLRIYAAELACAIDFIHREDMIYRDLKLENIILDGEGHIKLVDFGLAKHLKLGTKTSTICGTLQYMSPCVASGREYDHSVDWWSLAVVIHVLLTGRYPYPNAESRHHLDLRFVDYSTPMYCSPQLGNLLDRMLLVNSERRLSSFEVFHAHSFFEGIDFAEVEEKKYDSLKTMRWKQELQLETEAKSTLNGEENVSAYDEHYEFNDFDLVRKP